jgi:hypothetical protein
MAYVSVEVCSAGATTNCVIIPNVQVDTGSSGLRILASYPGVSGLNLSQVNTTTGSPVYECYAYPDGAYLWGPVVQAGFSMAGESATNVPIQVIDNLAAPANVLSSCNPIGGSSLGTSTLLQANGILGIGPALQDCGSLCTGSTVLPYYWVCSSSSACTSPAAVPTPTQVSNPVAFFNGSDNNGVMLTMGSVVSSGATSATGTLNFGIGTQTDNALGSSTKAYALSLSTLNGIAYDSIFATYNNVSYPAYVDSAENFLFLLDPTTIAAASAGAGITSCPGNPPVGEYYCTSSAPSLPFTIKDAGSDSSTLTLTLGNGTTLYNSSVANGGSNIAFSNLAGGYALANDEVILGMPFFYGRTVYVGIAGQAPPSGLSATTYGALGYWAF